MATRIRTLNFLPEIFQTTTNGQFLAATLDQLVAQPNTRKIQGYIGSKFGYGVNAKDYYVTEPTKTRTDYQLDPGVIFLKENDTTAKDFISYPGIVDSLALEGGLTADNNRLFNSQFYSWDSFTNLDSIINFNQYYWLPEGPERVIISSDIVYSADNFIVQPDASAYLISSETVTTPSANPTLTLLRGGIYTFSVNQETQFWIQGEPGVTGLSPTQRNVNTREIYGVTNNGATNGVVTFSVPQKNALDDFYHPGNNLVDVISTTPFDQINGALVNEIGGIDGVTALDGLTVMFYNTGVPDETGFVSTFYDQTLYDANDPAFIPPITVTVSSTTNSIVPYGYVYDVPGYDENLNWLTLNSSYSTSQLIVDQSITFNTPTIGGLVAGQIYYVREILNDTDFTISDSIGGDPVVLTTASGSMITNINQGLYDGGFYSEVAANYYTVTLLGEIDNPQIQLTLAGQIPINQKITAIYGTEWVNRSFYRSTIGVITLEPFNSAILDRLYYQDGTIPGRVGVINLIENNISNQINIITDILGKPNYTAPNGVVFTNGLKVLFQGDIYPESFNNVEYYVEGVGTAIELIPVTTLVSPGAFSEGEYIPYDTTSYDVGNYDSSLYVPVDPDYITIARNSINRNPWSRSNRWFHIDVINATAAYNNTPALITQYTQLENKAKRPIIEFYPNLRMFNSGAVGKNPIDFIDTKTTDAFSTVAGATNYYPDTAGWTNYSATIAPVSGPNTSIIATQTIGLTNLVLLSSTTGLYINDTISFGTTFGGITSGTTYFITEISGNYITISETKQGSAVILTTSGVTSVTTSIYPYSTTITVATSDVFGLFEIGQYITDSTDLLPAITFVTDVGVSGTDTIITVSWYNQSIVEANSYASVVTADTPLDNYSLFDGSRVVFSADNDVNVKNKIYISRFAVMNVGSTPVITLTEADDGLVLPDEQTAVYRGYNYKGKDFYYNGESWFEGQQKTQLQQSPKFDIFDSNGISFGDRVVYVGTSFAGSTLFSYGIGTGANDTVLGFPVRYSSVDNVGDISFDVSLNSDTFTYVNGTTAVTQKVNTGYVYNYTLASDNNPLAIRQLGWQTAVSPSVQYQVFEFDWSLINNSNNTFECDIAPIVTTPTQWPFIQVYINNKYLPNTDWTVTAASTDTTTVINIPTIDAVETVVQILILSDQVSKTAYFQTPINLNNNPLNETLTTANIGDIRGQYQSIFYNNPNTTGQVFGPNNYRDLGNLVPWGNRIIQNSASLVLPGTFLRNQSHNLFNSLLYNSKQYITFKTLLVDTVNNSDYSRLLTPATMLDNALDQINASHIDSQPFFWSDMLPSKAPYITNTYSFANTLDISVYPLSHIYNFETANYNGVLVYLIRDGVQTQLVKGTDYTVSTDSPSLTVTTDLQANDQIVINEYNQTYGSYVPNTPTKLGLYPATIPSVVLDTAYNPATYFIVGHDGSFNKLYGNYNTTTGTLSDFRDQVLLEYETRVYNNLKLSTTVPAGSYQGLIIPGFFRQTDYTYDEFLQIYSESFLNWVGQNRIDYKTQFYNSTNQFTYNYRDSGNKIDKQPIEQGYFRGLYLYFYDTSTPNETPWEMLGLANQPSWWTTRYGPAPYTSDNLVLWGDLAAGLVWNNGDSFIKPNYARPGLLSIIPVNSNGDLLPPLESVVGNYDRFLFQRDWQVGDVGPAEFSYRRSSTWPFDLMRILAVTKPSDFFNLGVDVDNYKYNAEFNQYLVNDRSHLVISDVPIYGAGTPATSYINWIVDYEKQVGVDATTNITTLLDNLDVRLVYRVAGFSDKNLLKFYVEKSSANSNNSSLLIPDESYGLILYENQPFDRIVYSGVVIQITENGFKVYGNNQINAYFKILTPKFGGTKQQIKVEGLTVEVTDNFYDTVESIPYGTEFYNVQQVSQFLISYGEYLRTQGMVYEEIENGIPINWTQMVAEFLYWSQIGWEVGSITTINPAANLLLIDKESRIVQPLTMQQSNFVLNQDLYPIPINDLKIVREGTAFSAKPLNVGDAISYGQFNISNIENGIVFDNVTLFNDVIYNLVTGLRQYRISVSGTKTADWTGNIDAAGFILNQDNIVEWNKEIKYTAGSIVKYKNKYWSALKIIQASSVFNERDWKETDYNEIQKGLLPNSQTRSYESTLYYDVNKANLENDSDLLSFSLIGYRPRDYLALVDLTDITQVNVYQNLIKDKGTLNAASAFKGANLPQGGIDYDVYENWAIKSGEFGGTLNNNFIEFRLSQPDLTGNPSIVGLTTGIYTDGVQQEVPLYSVFNYGTPITSPDILPTISTAQPSTLYPTAGYVNYNDVKMASYYYSGLYTAKNSAGTTIPINEFYVRDYVWLANYLSTWQVYTPNSLGSVINAKNNLNNTVTITFSQPHNLARYQPFAIVNFDTVINNYYIVAAVVDEFNVIINLALNPQIKNVTGQGIGFSLQSQRVATAPEIINLPLLDNEFNKLKVWVDTNNNGDWAVYRKSLNYQYDKEITHSLSQTFGSAVAYTNDLAYLIGDSDAGKVYRYRYNELDDSYNISQTITHNASFGSNISYSDDLFVISETTGNVYVYQLLTTTLTNTLKLYQTIPAPGGVTTWGTSTAISGDKNWLYISAIDNNTVYVYRKMNVSMIATAFTVGNTYVIESLGTTDWNTVAGTSGETYVVGDTIIAASVGTGTGTALNVTYINVDTLTTSLSAGDNFGYSIATDYYGDSVIVGTPQKDYDVNTQNYGYTYVFARTVQNFEAQSTSQAYIPLTFALAWTPTTGTASSASTSGTTITLGGAGITGLSNYVNYPVIFSGTLISGGAINQNTVYYIKTVTSDTQFSISATRGGSTISLATDTGTGMTVTVQETPLFVSINGAPLTDDYYAVIGSTFYVYSKATSTVNAGDIINVSGINFVLAQTLTNEETPRVGVQFGLSVDTNTFANEILIGAPFELSEQNYEGAVHRYTNGGERYGAIIGTVDCNITTPRTILLNGYKAVLPVGNATTVAASINLLSLTNIQASAVAGKLIIALVNVDLGVAGNKLSLTVLDTATLGEMGVTLFKQTQKVNCPHLTGRTQFGTVVKFDNSGSFVASAPVGTRFSATTFDFTDDELDNDTVFDNNATKWLDTFINAGAVYMFDYLSTYNESLDNPGKFVYAQSTNAQDLDYGSQPYYGTALDFNDNRVTIGTPNFNPVSDTTDTLGQVVTYVSASSEPDWAVYRSSSEVVDINGVFNIQLFSARTNETLVNLDYIDPLQGKLLGAVTENIDVVSNNDPASYNSPGFTQSGLVWGADKVGQIWFDTSNARFMNYHQNDVNYNSQYWGRVFPGSDVAVYSWIGSPVPPAQYTGPGLPYSINNYTIRGVINAEGLITPVYYFWARNTNIVFDRLGKTLADSILQSYIAQPQLSGISYFTPLLPNVFGLYNCFEYINATDTVLHLGYSVTTNDDVAHNQYSLIRANYADDFLSGVPGSGALYQNHASAGITEPIGLYNRMLDSMCGVDNAGGVVPDPLLPKAVQTGVLARPRQGFFYNRFGALKNYLQYANVILAQFPIIETRNPQFLYRTGEFFDTRNYWNTINWWAPGYNDNTKSSLQVSIYADLSTLDVPVGTIVTVAANSSGNAETYIYEGGSVWLRIGLANGTIEFSSALWDYAEAKLGFGDNFFDTNLYDEYPSTETRYIVRALNEEIYTNELLVFRNKSLILLFEYIQSETIESQNYLTWLNKTSFLDVSHTIRELLPLEVFRSDNQLFLEGYLNEVKPFHVVIKEFIFKYTRTEVFEGDITDFDLPAQYDAEIAQFVTPQLVYANASGDNQYLPTDPIWQTAPYSQWYENYGLSISGQDGYQISVLSSYMSLNSTSCFVDNVNGFPVTGTLLIGEEYLSYSNRNLATGELTGLSRGIHGTAVSIHIPGEDIFIDLPAVLVLNEGRGYVNPPRVTAYIDLSIYPAPRVPAQLEPIMSLGTVIGVTILNPGEGYAVLPQIIIDPAFTVSVDSAQVNTVSNTIGISSPILQTGDLVVYTVAAGGTEIVGLVPGQRYYVNLLEIAPSPIFALYGSYLNALRDHNRIVLGTQGSGSQYFSVGAIGSCVTSSIPIRENSIALRFDRTTYDSQVIPWTPGNFYGSFYAGTINNSAEISSSSITLESSSPPISQILASAHGVSFEILDAENQQTLTWSSRTRSTVQTYGPASLYPNAIRINPSLGGVTVDSYIGSTIGFYIGMPIKFVGSTIGTTLTDGVTYYVKSLVKLPNLDTSVLEDTGFTVSETVDVDGNPGVVLAQNTATIVTAGLTLYVGQLTNLAVLTINYDGIRTVTATTSGTNQVTVQLTLTGQDGTTGLYLGAPIFFTGNVFGGIVENEIYYVITIIDNQTFTMSLNNDPITFEVTATSSSNNSVTCDSTSGLAVNEPVIFTGTTFGNIVAGTTYYVREIFSGNTSFSIATSVNGAAVILTDDTGSCTLTSQADALVLTTASGTMTMNIGLPVSPGQINGQEFTFYETSTQYSNVSGTVTNLLTREIQATLETVGRICLSSTGIGLTNIYDNLEFNVESDIGGLTVAGGPYTVTGTGVTEIIVSSTTGTGNWLIVQLSENPDTTDVLYVGMPIRFSGTSLGGVSLGEVYYVYEIDTPGVSTGRFKISSDINLGSFVPVTNSNGSMTGSGDPYIEIADALTDSVQTASITTASPAVVTVSNGDAYVDGTAIRFDTTGSLPVPLSSEVTYYVKNSSGGVNGTFNIAYSPTGVDINTTIAGTGTYIVHQEPVTLTQETGTDPVFDASYILGGYRATIISNGSGYAVDNIITILGTDVGGTTPVNDLQLTVLTINSTGGVTSAIASGTPAGVVDQYYLKVLSETQVGVYSNPNLTVPVSGQNFPYVGITSTAATATNSGTDRVTVTSSTAFAINDPVVFTGTVFGNIVLGDTYYIASKPTSTTVTLSETMGGSTFQLATSSGNNMTMARSGDYVFLPEPFYFNPSIVKYNNRLYQCVISNNDPEFIFGKWELLTSGDKKLNALDRIIGYYQPTVNMPGVDLTQLVTGITYPNSTYLGNAFAPADEYALDTILQDQSFYPTGVDLKAVVWNGLVYIAGSDASTYSAFNVSADATTWSINKLANQSLFITDLLYAGGSYVITTNNNATPILVSDNGYTWISNGTFTPFDGIPYDMGNFDVSSVLVPSLSLNSVTYHNGVYVAVGENIVTSTDLYSWTERYAFTNGLTNVFNGVSYVSTPGYTGYVAVGFGQELITGIAIDFAIIYTSPDAYTWTQVTFNGTSLGFNSIASNNQTIVAVGDDGIIYTSFNTINWFPQSSTVANTLTNIIWDSYNNKFVAVGHNGVILTGTSDGITWTQQTSGVTSILESTVWNNDAEQYVVVGRNNAILTSPDAITWTVSATFETTPSIYTVQGDAFTSGYGPEELVPGVVSDTITMTVATRPGTDWDETVYEHVGYNVVSIEITPTDASQVLYDFYNVVTTPAQIAVFVIDYTTGLSTSIYEGLDYSIDWINKVVELNTPITYVSPGTADILRIDVYEVGNGDQLVKANTETDPIRTNEITGFNEIYVNANYSASIYQGSGVIRPDTSPINVVAFKTDSTTNAITCEDVESFTLNSPITFSGSVFGGIVEDQVYYVKTIGAASNRITISETYNLSTGTAGETFLLTSATGSMQVIIQVGTGLPWTPPAVYHNGHLLVLGATALVIKTKASNNAVTTISTGGLIVDSPIVFSNTMFGDVIVPQQIYYIKQILDGNEFTISETQGGSVLTLTDASGGATFVTNDYAIGLADNGITAALIFASQYNTTDDYLTYTLMGQTVPIQYGYTIPQVELFTGDNVGTASFMLSNYVGGDNPTNAIVEINGVRQTESAYTISSLTNTILFYTPPSDGDVIAVTTYNQTERQYLHTQYGITGSSGSQLTTVTVGSTTHDVSTFDQDTPTVNTFDQDTPSLIAYDQELNYLTLASGTTGNLTVNSPIIFSSPTIGGIVAGQIYYITEILNSTDFTISITVGGLPTVVTTDTGSMNGVVNGLTVANIVAINNNITPPTLTLPISGTQVTTNYVLCGDTAGLIATQNIIFKSPVFAANGLVNTNIYQILTLGDTDWTAIGASATPYAGEIFTATGAGTGTGTAILANVGGIQTTGQVYFVETIAGPNEFTIMDQFGNQIALTTTSESLISYMGGTPSIRVTTGIDNNLVEDDIVRIDGLVGSTQLNNNTYYVHVITNTIFDLYTQPFNPALNAVNYPVTSISAYVSGGYVWIDDLFTIVDTLATSTTAVGNRITVNDTNVLVPNTPVVFTQLGVAAGTDLMGGILAKTQYYVYVVRPEIAAGNFIIGNEYEIVILGTTDWNTAAGTVSVTYAVGDTFIADAPGSGTGFATGLQEFTITENRYPDQAEVVLVDDTGSINVTEFEQVNVDRLWVTVNGRRVPSSSLKLNEFNNLSILTTVETGDQIIITSMMPTATPNEEVYLLNVNTSNEASVYRANIQTRTWLTEPLQYTDEVIYLNDVHRVTDSVVQDVTCPAAVDGKYNIGLTSDKNTICHLSVYNSTTSVLVNPANFKIIIVDTAPILQIYSQVAEGNELVITSVVGRLIYLNGEQIGFGECDLENNTISLLSRGANGTGVQNYIPVYTEVFGIIPSNRMSDVLYASEWNPIPGVYNTVEGDPLQIAYTAGADFLRTDRN